MDNRKVAQADTVQEKRLPRVIHDSGSTLVILLSGGSLLMSLRRREAQGASDFGRFERIFGHRLRPLTGRFLVLAYNSKYDSTHVQ